MPAPTVTPASYINNYATLNSSLSTDNFVKFGTTSNASAGSRHLLELTTAEADPATGSASKLFWALAQMMHRSMNHVPDLTGNASTNPVGNASVARDAADATNASAVLNRKSSKMSATQSMSTDNTSGTPVITQTFVFTFTLGATGLDVTAD